MSHVTYAAAVKSSLPSKESSPSVEPKLQHSAKKANGFAARALPALLSPQEFPPLSALHGRLKAEKNN